MLKDTSTCSGKCSGLEPLTFISLDYWLTQEYFNLLSKKTTKIWMQRDQYLRIKMYSSWLLNLPPAAWFWEIVRLSDFLFHENWGEWKKKKKHGQSITLEKVKWPPIVTRISRHGHYLPAACTDTHTPCKQFCPHGTQRHSQMHKQITWLTGVFTLQLTLTRKGRHSCRLPTVLIMEVSHQYSDTVQDMVLVKEPLI